MIVVLTCPGRPYLADTLRQIDESAKGPRVVLVDGTETPCAVKAPWTVLCRPRGVVPPQNKWTAWDAFALAAEADEDLCFFEDDLEFCRNGAAFIEQLPVPEDLPFITFFSPWMTPELPIGLWRIHTSAYVMAQALKFSRRVVRELALCRHEPIWKEALALGGFDEILRYISIKKRWRFGIFNPCLVQHVGAMSVVGNGGLSGMRVAKNYVGKDVDALLFKRTQEEFFS